MNTNKLVFALFLAPFAAGALVACSTVDTRPMPAMASGGLLTGANGMTLYVFDRDPAGGGKSVCNGPCAANWPPLQAVEGAQPGGDYAIVQRDDGTRQWAYKGKPLYFWSKDTKAGDTTGDGFNNVWHVAKP